MTKSYDPAGDAGMDGVQEEFRTVGEQRAGRLRNRIQQIRIDYPEVADVLRLELAELERSIKQRTGIYARR